MRYVTIFRTGVSCRYRELVPARIRISAAIRTLVRGTQDNRIPIGPARLVWRFALCEKGAPLANEEDELTCDELRLHLRLPRARRRSGSLEVLRPIRALLSRTQQLN
jgi:hypothetical protein